MRKSLLYLSAALILGILIIITPLLALAPFVKENPTHFVALFFGESYTHAVNAPNPYYSDLTILTISFVIAMIVYLFVRHRIHRPEPPWVRLPPF
jgi:hypothetical protein